MCRPSCDSTVSFCAGITAYCCASQLTPRKNTARMPTIHPSVFAAFFGAGARKAVIPFEIASVPVIAAHPSANPRSMR